MQIERVNERSRSVWSSARSAKVMALAIGILFLLVYADSVGAQGRLNQLLETRYRSEPPVPQVERLRQDIVRATDQWGRLHARQLQKPPGPGIVGPGGRIGVGLQMDRPPGAGIVGPGGGIGLGQQMGEPPGAGIVPPNQSSSQTRRRKAGSGPKPF